MDKNCRLSHVEKLSSEIGLTCMHRLCYSHSTADSLIRLFLFCLFNTSYSRLRWNLSNIFSWCRKPAAVVDVSTDYHVLSVSILLLEVFFSDVTADYDLNVVYLCLANASFLLYCQEDSVRRWTAEDHVCLYKTAKKFLVDFVHFQTVFTKTQVMIHTVYISSLRKFFLGKDTSLLQPPLFTLAL
jgi:hypothetical protein